MSARCWQLILALLFVSPALPVMAETIVVQTEGNGANLQEATGNALVEAVRQVNGVSIKASQLLSSMSTSVAGSDAEGSSMAFSVEERQASKVAVRSGGHLAGYRVLESGPSDYGYRAVVEARVYRYRAPGIDTGNRRRLAVIPFTARIGSVDFFGPVGGAEFASLLSQAVLGQFVQSRRFAILDRESWQVIGQERDLLGSAATPIAEKAKLGQVLGADYLVMGEVLEGDGGTGTYTERLTGVRRAAASASLAVAYRIVVPASGEVKFADVIELSTGNGFDSRVGAMNEFARQMVGMTMDRIYPIRVVSVDGVQLVLNQGGSTLLPGDRLTLVTQGAALIDPYTHEPLGRIETALAEILVERVDGKLAYARVADGTSKVGKVGDVVRRSTAGTLDHSQVPAPTPRTEGVRLPFDP